MANPRHANAKVQKLVDHGSGVFSVWLNPDLPPGRFKVGQFLHLALDPYSPEKGYWPESRVFSIASPPSAEFLRIVYSVKGRYTSRMREELAAGRVVSLKYPFGDFFVDTGKPDVICVLIAGGTGISPFVGLLSRREDLGRVWLYYGIREPSLLIFTEEVQTAVTAGMNLELSVEHADDSPSIHPDARVGPLDVDAIHRRHGSGSNVHYYVSGPPGMIESFKSRLLAKAVAPQKIHIDEWE